MKYANCKWVGIIGLIATLIIPYKGLSQITSTQREYAIHNRGMLHQTVYNTGELSQTWNDNIENKITLPYMEWPAYSRTIIEAVEYDGQMNSFGGGIQITANFKGDMGTLPEEGRLVAFCGGVGKGGDPVPAFGIWSFPISQEVITNYPLLNDGTLNPDFNPNEAEQIIVTKFNTSAGIMVTRTSRAYSYPDFDDFIIYEYTLENNGIYYDNDANQLVQVDTTFVDVMVNFIYGLSPSALGSARYDSKHLWDVHYKMNFPACYWDPDYWLLYNQVTAVNGDSLLAGRPEILKENFFKFAETGINGGGLLSPQAAGFSMMFYDTEHLSIIDTTNPALNQSPQFVALDLFQKADSNGIPLDWDPITKKIKQPYKSFIGNSGNALSKTEETINNFKERNGPFYGGVNDTWLPEIYQGRFVPLDEGNYVWSCRTLSFGPYYLEPGEKIEFTIAEILGYGADPNKLVVGGPGLNAKPPIYWTKGFFWDKPVKVEGEIVTENYVADYGIPDYVNSDVVYVNNVAHKASEAYLGKTLYDPNGWNKENPEFWPENHPKDGSYTVPIPIPAPQIDVVNTDTGTVIIKWGRYVEEFEVLYPGFVTGKLDSFIVFRSDYKMGPWIKLGTIPVGDVNYEGIYEFTDRDKKFFVEETKYYAVTTIDEHGNQSGKTNLYEHKKAIGATEKLTKVYVVPNPFVVESGFEGLGADRMLGIYGLPEKCTIYFYSFAGQLLWTIQHDAREYSDNWEQITTNNQDLATGVYFFVVTTPSGEKYMGKFMVIK